MTETFEYLATEYGGLKSIALIFHDKLTSDGERKGLHCLKFRNPWQSSLEKFRSLKLENLWTIKIWCSSLEMLRKQVNHQVAVIVDTYDRQGNDGKKTRYEVQVLFLEYLRNRWQYEIYYWRRFRTLVSLTKSKERYVEGVNWREALQRSIYKVHYREILMS